jgi:hypothetical protein
MLRSFFYIIISVALVSCGKEQGVEAKIHRKTNVTPQMVVTTAKNMLPKKSVGQENSISSQSIRQDTYGFRVKSQANSSGTTLFTIEHFERLPDNKCRNTIHTIDISSNSLDKWSRASTMQVSCYDKNCNYLLLLIEQSASSFADGKGTLVPAYVPVILEKVEKSSGIYYEAMNVSETPFLKLEVDTICMNSSQVVKYPTHFAISPVDDNAPKYDYYPDQYNNTWIY